MYKVVRKFPPLSVVVVLGFAMTLAMTFQEASASESSASTGSHVASTGEISSIELGPSQEARCKRTIQDDRLDFESCASAKRILALMRAEPRDKVWADKMESDLSEWVESHTSEGFTLRNVECRLSWCIVEVGSAQKRILEMHLRNQSTRKLFDRLDLFAPDVDDPNVQDQLIIYKRYCDSVSEILDGNGHLVPNFYTVGQKCGRR